MADAGIECSDLFIDDPEPGEGSPTTGPTAIKVGYCRLEGAPEVGDLPLETRILIFEDESHIHALPPPELLADQALVYGDTWEVFVVPGDKGDEVQDALGGRLVE